MSRRSEVAVPQSSKKKDYTPLSEHFGRKLDEEIARNAAARRKAAAKKKKQAGGN